MIDFELLSGPEISEAIITLLRSAFEKEISDTCILAHDCNEKILEEKMQKADIVSVWSFANGIEEVPKKDDSFETLAAANQIPTHVILGYHQCDQAPPCAPSDDIAYGPPYMVSTIYPLPKETYNKLFKRYVSR